MVTTPAAAVSYSKERPDAMEMVFQALSAYSVNVVGFSLGGYIGAFPTIFIDEANVLRYWGPRELEELMRQVVRISKQECGANIVLLSSENFFKSWIDHMPGVQGHVMIGNFTKDEALAFADNRWTQETFLSVLERVVSHPDGVVPYSELVALRDTVDSMAEHHLLQYRDWTGWQRDGPLSTQRCRNESEVHGIGEHDDRSPQPSEGGSASPAHISNAVAVLPLP
ncbi:hypothetical protein SELMODRAFT_424119 [Selaginella moellendorffii]|uniref:Uncharacterized protein n=1 Tax=Selaginella moellendorffii TaxID=88036 RepID=D8SNW0_SELML|nr:hypothetical protein SELMODRAFT_424119 [Selaginella moellendorffii]